MHLTAKWWKYRPHPSKWKFAVVMLLCLMGTTVIYKSFLTFNHISNSLNHVNNKMRRFDSTFIESPNNISTTSLSNPSHVLENTCRFPSLTPWEEDVKHHSSPHGPVECAKTMVNLATLTEDHELILHHDLDGNFRSKFPIDCEISRLYGTLRPTKSAVKEEKLDYKLKINSRVVLEQDQFVVRCFNKTKVNVIVANKTLTKVDNSKIYERGFAGFANQNKKKETLIKSTSTQPSLAILILDSTSRNQFLRHAPKSHKFMKDLGFIDLEMYTKIDDNSAVNLFPILAGKATTRRVAGDGRELLGPDKHPVNHEEYEHIWDTFKKRKCVTMFNDDIMHPSRGLFAYHHHEGFTKPPTDYYFRPFEVFNVRNQIKPSQGMCTKFGEPVMSQHFTLYERFSRVFKDYCHFSLNFFTTMTHDHGGQLESIDEQIRGILEKFKAIDVTNNTALVIMGDHGNRIGSVQFSFTGRIEERTPYFSLYLPEGFRRQYPEMVENFKVNTNRLTSNYDIYRTLKEFALGVEQDKDASKYRGYNLLRERVPVNRTCSDAGIPENHCVCTVLQPLPKYLNDSNEYNQIKETVKNRLKEYDCINVAKLKIMEEVMRTSSINNMVRKGMRNMPVNASEQIPLMFKEAQYIDVNVEVPSKNGNDLVELLIQVKMYTKSKTFSIQTAPLVVKVNGINVTNHEICNCFTCTEKIVTK